MYSGHPLVSIEALPDPGHDVVNLGGHVNLATRLVWKL